MEGELKDIHYWPITRLAKEIRSGRISSVDVTTHLLFRIKRLDSRLHSYVSVQTDDALKQARRADMEIASGIHRGPLQGVPLALKDNLYTANAPTTVGSAVLKEFTPRWDATAVQRLKDAGAVLLGKLAMTEGAASDHPPERKAPVNPWHADYWTGISSSGPAVAVAAGLCFGAIATDSGGSIRMPSAACGVTGLKPTWGRVSVHGAFPLCASRDHIGPMARSAYDIALLLQVIAGHDPQDPTSLREQVEDYSKELNCDVSGLRLGVDWSTLTDGVDPPLQQALRATVERFETLGMRVRAVQYPSPDGYLKHNFSEAAAEIAATHAKPFAARADEYGEVLRAVIQAGVAITAADLARAQYEKLRLNSALAYFFNDIDLLLLPVFPNRVQTTAHMRELLRDAAKFVQLNGRYTLPFNGSGHPALTLPCGVDEHGLPISVQLIGKHLNESTLLRAGASFQNVTDWHARHPV